MDQLTMNAPMNPAMNPFPTFRYAVSHEELSTIDGYMRGPTKLPHVMTEDFVLWFPNAFMARVAFMKQNPDIDQTRMNRYAKDEQTVLGGFVFFRFLRTVQ